MISFAAWKISGCHCHPVSSSPKRGHESSAAEPRKTLLRWWNEKFARGCLEPWHPMQRQTAVTSARPSPDCCMAFCFYRLSGQTTVSKLKEHVPQRGSHVIFIVHPEWLNSLLFPFNGKENWGLRLREVKRGCCYTASQHWECAYDQYLLIQNSFGPQKVLGVCTGGMWRGGVGRSGIDLKFDWMWADMGLFRVITVVLITLTVPGK